MKPSFRITVVLLVLVACTSVVGAQDAEAPDANARVHLGPLSMNPTLGLTNIGVDTNVFFEPDQQAPKRDFTMTLVPATDLWLRMGRAWLSSTLREDLVYYQRYTSQRSANNSDTLGITVPLNRLTLKGGGRYVNATDRPGYEISERVHHVDSGYNGSVDLRLMSKTFVGVHGERSKTTYDSTATFFGVNLASELDRESTTAGVSVRHQLTPLTALTFDGSTRQDRFTTQHARDADSKQLWAGVEFDPFALLKGAARIGYRDFSPLDPTIPPFKGTTVDVNISYVALGSTKLTFQANRDVQFSYDINQPYYLQTRVSGSLAQQIYGPVDAVGRASYARLSYTDRSGAFVQVAGMIDRIEAYGGGVGYHFGPDLRLGFNVDEQRRTSPIGLRDYHGFVIGMSATFGY